MRVIFTYLSAFSNTGGIEKFNKAFMKALDEISVEDSFSLNVISAHDKEPDEKYLTKSQFKGFNSNLILFVLYSLIASVKCGTFFFGHINLAPLGLLVRIINPNSKIILIAHGIEVWKPLSGLKKFFLNKCNHILAVSNFTKSKIVQVQKINPEKIKIFPNTLDPYFPLPDKFEKPEYLLNRYMLKKSDDVLLTIGRVSFQEKYKGYDKVIENLPTLVKEIPSIKYLVVGKYDIQEKSRIDQLAKQFDVEDKIIITGFVTDEELVDHYLLADVFIMLSTGEGFGIVFLEALACGLPVIASNSGGVADALLGNNNCVLINSFNKDEVLAAVKLSLSLKKKGNKTAFNFNKYKSNLVKLMDIFSVG